MGVEDGSPTSGRMLAALEDGEAAEAGGVGALLCPGPCAWPQGPASGEQPMEEEKASMVGSVADGCAPHSPQLPAPTDLSEEPCLATPSARRPPTPATSRRSSRKRTAAPSVAESEVASGVAPAAASPTSALQPEGRRAALVPAPEPVASPAPVPAEPAPAACRRRVSSGTRRVMPPGARLRRLSSGRRSAPVRMPTGQPGWPTLSSVTCPPAAGRERSRSRTPPRDSAASSRRPTVVILDGMNILRSCNLEAPGPAGAAPLEWGQLEEACRFFARRRCRVSVFLPPIRAEHEPEAQRLRRLFGEVFVICHGGGSADDNFMINTVKVMQDQEAHEELRDGGGNAVPQCRIVTNDGFRDWQRSGHVDASWVERYCVRYTFGPLGFVPSTLL